MKLHELSPAPGSAKAAWRKGRGPGSGNGKTAGRGHKGQNAVRAAVFVRDLKGGRTRFTEDFPKEASTTTFQQYIQSSM